MATDLKALREQLGIGDNVPDSDLKILLSTKTGQDLLSHVATQPKGESFWQAGFGALEHPYTPGGPISEFGSWLTDSLKKAPALKPKAKTAEAAKPLPSPQEAAASVPESPYQQLAQALAGEYLNQINQLMPLTSGSAIPGMTNQVVSEAAQAIPGGGAWLQQQAAAEQKAAAPLFGAMNKVGEAQAQGAIPYAGAIANTGTANTQYLEAAPWQQILSELASETAYKAASTQGATAFGATPQNTPAFLQQIFNNLGLGGASQVPGGLSAPGAKTPANKTSSSALSNTSSQTG